MAGTRIELEGLLNTRDLGGYQTRDGRRIKEKKILRSGALSAATKQDIQILLEQYHLKTIIDFRTETERVQKPDPEIAGISYIPHSILQEAQMGITHEGEARPKDLVESMIAMCREIGEQAGSYLANLYPVLVTDQSCIARYRAFFDLLLRQKEGSVLYHCSEGKDRVGTATALFLSALDVDRATILEDYLLTNQYTEQKRQYILSMIQERVPDDAVLHAHFLTLNSVHESYLQSVFSTIDQTYGSMDIFLAEKLGLDRKKRAALQDLYLI